MNALIVDDDRFVVASLKDGIPWAKFGIDTVFTAYNAADAKEMISSRRIDFLLSDIDMPYGSGLDLLMWIREQGNDMPAIFLTNYADFSYAQKAMELNSFRYFLKPVDYDKLSNAISEVILQISDSQTIQHERYERFWGRVIHDEIKPSLLQQEYSALQIQGSESDYFIPVVIDLFPYRLASGNVLKSCFSTNAAQYNFTRAAFIASFSDCFADTDAFLEYDAESSRYMAIFRSGRDYVSPLISMDCESFIQVMFSKIRCPSNCFIGMPSRIPNFMSSLAHLKQIMSNKLDVEQKVILWSQRMTVSSTFPPCNREAMALYLEHGQFSSFLNYCGTYLRELSMKGCLHAESMNSFQADALQTIYSFIDSKGFSVKELFSDESNRLLSHLASNSTREMMMYLQYLVNILEIRSRQEAEQSTPEAIRSYIDKHYTEEIGLNALADQFYMDPDYISKLFRREFGTSIKNYITDKRISDAKELLIHSALPVNIVATSVGYENYSYFSRLFKKITKETPQDFRRRYGQTEINEDSRDGADNE